MLIEATAMITFLKTIGIDAGRIVEGLFIFFTAFSFMLYVSWRHVWPMFKKFIETMDELKTSVTDLNKTLQEHIVQTDLRLQEGTENFEILKRKIDELTKRIIAIESKGD
jgi:predicted PurR-regulated permease PerM